MFKIHQSVYIPSLGTTGFIASVEQGIIDDEQEITPLYKVLVHNYKRVFYIKENYLKNIN